LQRGPPVGPSGLCTAIFKKKIFLNPRDGVAMHSRISSIVVLPSPRYNEEFRVFVRSWKEVIAEKKELNAKVQCRVWCPAESLLLSPRTRLSQKPHANISHTSLPLSPSIDPGRRLQKSAKERGAGAQKVFAERDQAGGTNASSFSSVVSTAHHPLCAHATAHPH
jgi:hypothetical protein